MTDWFRSWHGAPTDPKWLGIARRAGVAPGIAVAIAWALMDRASQAEDRGSINGYDAEGLGCFFGCEPEEVEAIVRAMSDKGMIADGRLTSWEKRQPKREDTSSQRVREHRERKKQHVKRDETQRNAPDTDTDTDISGSYEPSSPEPEKSAPGVIDLPCASGDPYSVSDDDVAEWEESFPAVDVRQQLGAMRSWLNANPTRRKTKKGMRRFIVSWLDRRQNSGPAPPLQQPRGSPGKPPSAFDQFSDYVNSMDDDDGQADFEAHSPHDSGLRLIAGHRQS